MNKSTKKFVDDRLHNYKISIYDVYDADTITVDIDLGFGVVLQKQKVRLSRINAYEVTRRKGTTQIQKLRGIAGRDWLAAQLCFAMTNKETIFIRSSVKRVRGKFGRILGELYIGSRNINDELVKLEYAKYQEY